RFGRRVENIDRRAAQARAVARLAADHEEIASILRIKGGRHVGAAQADALYPPVAAGEAESRIGVDGLMRLVESANSDMQDACAAAFRIIGRHRNARERSRSGAEPHGHCPSPATGCDSATMMPRSSASPFKRPMVG